LPLKWALAVFNEVRLLKFTLFVILFLFSVFEAQANRLLLVVNVLSEEVVKRGLDETVDARLKPFQLEGSNYCGIQFVKFHIESVLDGEFIDKVIDTHVILGEWCGKPFEPSKDYVVKLFDKEDSLVSLHKSKLDGWEVFNLYAISELSDGERVLKKDWHVKHFDHLEPSIISYVNNTPIVKVRDLKAWHTANKPLKQDK
jgi:hypothetical protein